MQEIKSVFTYVFTEVSVATFVLFVMFVSGALIAINAQRREDFDFADMLRDPVTGKPSSGRLASIVSLVFSCWFLVYAALSVPKDAYSSLIFSIFCVFISVWSGAKIVEKGIDAWAAVKGAPLTSNLMQPTPSVVSSVVTSTTESISTST